MTNCSMPVSAGSWVRRISGPLLGAALLAGSALPASAEDVTFSVPEKLSTALGWKPMPDDDYEPYRTGSVFDVGSDPSQWPLAREQAALWAQGSPTLAENPAEFFIRTLARIEALALGAADEAVANELEAERTRLAEAMEALRDPPASERSDWPRREALSQVADVRKALGSWLADSPADRVQAFREELESHRPIARAKLAARYGGEERLAELIKLGQELNRLTAAFEAAKQDKTSPEAERKAALRKAGGALGYFYGYHQQDQDLHTVMRDPDLASEFGGQARMNHRRVEVPDLVLLTNHDEAAALLAEAYALPVTVNLSANSRTGALARRLLVEGSLSPKHLPWSLIGWANDTVDTAAAKELVALHDVLVTHFPELTETPEKGSDWRARSGRATLAYALAAEGRMDEAAALLRAAGEDASGLPYRARLSPEVAVAAWDLLVRVYAEAANDDVWSRLGGLAAAADRRAELIAFAAKQAEAAPKDSANAKIWRVRHGWALVGSEKIDEGLALVLPTLDARPVADENEWAKEWSSAISQLFLLAKVLDRPELATAWNDTLATEFKTPTASVWNDSELFDAFATRQLAAGNFALIEALLSARIDAGTKQAKGHARSRGYDTAPQIDLRETTVQLADVLGRQGRHADVVALLAESPHWNTKDLAEVLAQGSKPWRRLGLVAAESLHAVGRTDEARAIVEAYLVGHSGYDPAYALYTRIAGADAAAYYEKLWAADHFEERPLIWLASLQLAAGNIAEAEATVGRAIATDPSDGEQPKGDRMRAYAVLREVALAKGDAKQAEFLAGVVAAIRLSEDADDLVSAGLIDRAIAEYNRALDSFDDAYCIQSRLARQLAEENRLPEAMEHYKRAFELMPDSFGRVESHCFGCERAFAGEDAQSIAERVFTEMAAQPDAKPQVQYLLGYLRMEQERWEEAAEHFSKATVADPDYLNAWKKLAEVLPNTSRPRAEQDRVAFRLLALDPAGKHGSQGNSTVRDLPALWRVYANAQEAGLIAPKTVYPLGAKAASSDKQEEDVMSWMNRRESAKTPAERLAQHAVLESITRALDSVYQWRQQAE